MSYGYNIMPESDMKDLLLEKRTQESGVQYWKGVLGEAGQTYSAQQNVLTSDYSDAIAQAYASNMKNRNAIDASGLNKTGASAASALSRQELMSTFDKYLSNYSSALASAREQYQQNMIAVDKALTTEAQNYRTLYSQKAYEYLTKELGNSSMNGKSALESLDWMYNTEKNEMTGDVTKTMRDWEDLLRNELTDEEGNLTVRGQQFYDAAFNFSPSGYEFSDGDTPRATRSFDQYLSETDPELREWYASPDYTNYVNGAIPTKGGSMRNDLGAKLSDYMYNKQEAEYRRASGVSEKFSGDLDKVSKTIYNNINDTLNSLGVKSGKDSPTRRPTSGNVKLVSLKNGVIETSDNWSLTTKRNAEKSVETTSNAITEISNALKDQLPHDEYEDYVEALFKIEKPSLSKFGSDVSVEGSIYNEKGGKDTPFYWKTIGKDPEIYVSMSEYYDAYKKYLEDWKTYYTDVKNLSKQYIYGKDYQLSSEPTKRTTTLR